MPLVCSTCDAVYDRKVPIDKKGRRHSGDYVNLGSGKVHRLHFSVCQMCDTLMGLNRWERYDRPHAVVLKHLQKKALEGGAS